MNTQRQAVVKAVNDLTDSNVPEEFREQMLEAARQS